jgi:hypothetical protein
MARRAVIDREELFKAADTLAADGKAVTALALVSKLGGGSLTTIYKYLADWEAERPKTTSPAVAGDIPDAVQTAFMSTWRVASMEAARETAVIKEKAAEEVRAANRKFDEALEGIQRLEVQGDQDAATIESLKKQIAELEEQLSKARSENAANHATAEQLREQVKAQQGELDRLHASMEKERKQRDAAATEAAELRGQTQSLKAQNTELLAKLSKK